MNTTKTLEGDSNDLDGLEEKGQPETAMESDVSSAADDATFTPPAVVENMDISDESTAVTSSAVENGALMPLAVDSANATSPVVDRAAEASSASQMVEHDSTDATASAVESAAETSSVMGNADTTSSAIESAAFMSGAVESADATSPVVETSSAVEMATETSPAVESASLPATIGPASILGGSASMAEIGATTSASTEVQTGDSFLSARSSLTTGAAPGARKLEAEVEKTEEEAQEEEEKEGVVMARFVEGERERG